MKFVTLLFFSFFLVGAQAQEWSSSQTAHQSITQGVGAQAQDWRMIASIKEVNKNELGVYKMEGDVPVERCIMTAESPTPHSCEKIVIVSH